MLGLRRVSFHIAFMGLGLRIRASAERWCDRSTDADILEEDARDIEVRGGRSAKVVSLGTRRLVEMLSLRTERGGARKAIRRGRVRQWRSVRAVAAHTALYIARAQGRARDPRTATSRLDAGLWPGETWRRHNAKNAALGARVMDAVARRGCWQAGWRAGTRGERRGARGPRGVVRRASRRAVTMGCEGGAAGCYQ